MQKKKLEQGDIFENWIPISEILNKEKCDKKYQTKDKDKSIRIASLYGISKYEILDKKKEEKIWEKNI